MKFYLYKGLKKPLIFFGLKGKYIYQALGLAVGTLVISIIVSTIAGLLATIITVAIGAATIWRLYLIQDKRGLYKKTKNTNQIHICPIRLNKLFMKK